MRLFFPRMKNFQRGNSLRRPTRSSGKAGLPRVLFSLGGFSAAFRVFIVSFKETVSLGSLVQPAFQFLNVETRFLMLAEGSRSEVSFHFRLESLCRKTWRSCACVLWMGLNRMVSAVSNRHAGLRFVRWGRVVLVFFGVLWACRVEPACRLMYV